MHQFLCDDNFNCGDTWPVGSFRLKEATGLIDEIIESFDVPCWPELTGLGEKEELIGFWLDLFVRWDEKASLAVIDEALESRPGLGLLLHRFQSQPLPLLKGQMIGPATLLWALKQANYPIIDRRQVLEFLYQAFVRQAYLLAKVSYKVIISLDEPSAGLESSSAFLWQEFFEKPHMDQQIGIALHCCGQPKAEWLSLPWSVVHFDWKLLADAMKASPEKWQLAWQDFFARGSWLAAGVVEGVSGESPEAEKRRFSAALESVEELFAPIGYERILLSTSCGLNSNSLSGVREKLNLLTLASRQFLENRKSH